MNRISKIGSSIKPSMIRKLFNLATTMDDVVDFTLGDPDIHPHANIKEAACRAIREGKTRYSQNAGLIQLRESICKRIKKKENINYDPKTEIAVTVGAMEGLYLTFLALLNPEDEVIIPAPYYVNYLQMVEMCNATPVIVNPSEADTLIVSAEDIIKSVTDKTKAIVINSPSNPTGKIFPRQELEKLANFAKDNRIFLITDEVYEKLNYENKEIFKPGNVEGIKDYLIRINSLSKEFCMTGYRIGYVLGPEDVISTIVKLQENVAACAPLPSQYAAIEAFESDEDYSKDMVSTFTQRRNALYEVLSDVDGLKIMKPEATFYALIDVRGLGYTSSEKFAYDLLEKAKVAVVPAVAYGDICEGYVRLAFTLNEERIREGAKRIKEFANTVLK